MIRIQMLTGPQSGLQLTHAEQRLTFGRAPQNSIAIDDPHLSRLHGELVFRDNQWLLINHSPNGTTVNRRAVTAKEPHPLKPGDTVSVGSTRLFTVQFIPSSAAPVEAAAVEAEPKKRMTKRAKIWSAIGAYFGVVVLVMIVFALKPGSSTEGLSVPPQLTAERIASIIRERPAVKDRDEREAERCLREARAWYARADSLPDGWYQAHFNYKLARANLKGSLEDTDQLQFNSAETRLIEIVTRDYDTAAKLIRNRQFTAGTTAFNSLKSIYLDTRSDLAQNIRAYLNYADAAQPRRKGLFER